MKHSPPQRPKGTLARILIVEDEDDLRMTLYDWLVRRGHHVMEAKDGLMALEIAAAHPFDLVLTDLKMPRCDGLQLLSCLERTAPTIDVVFLSGQASVQDAIDALRGGRSFDFLQKPIHDLIRLDEVVGRVMERRMQRGIVADATHGATTEWDLLPDPVAAALHDEPRLQQAFRFIEARFRSPIGLSEVAAATGYTPAYLTTQMRKVTGKTTQQWIIDYKMKQARHLLATSELPIQEIAMSLGYHDPNSFHRQFRKLHGMGPQSWRQQKGEP